MLAVAPESTHVPAPDLFRLVAPVLSPITEANVFAPVFVPVRLSVCALVLPKAIEPGPVKLMVPAATLPDASNVAELPFASPIVKRRLVLVAVEPVY